MHIPFLVPDRHNFLTLLKEAEASGQVFVYRRVPWGKNLYIHHETVAVIINILCRLYDHHREDLLDLVPLEMTRLTMKCWELQINQVRYRRMFKIIEPVERESHQHEFIFMERKDDHTGEELFAGSQTLKHR